MKISIKNKMDEVGITRYELAKRIGITYPTITNIYEGKTTSIKLDILESICRELNCTPNDILIMDPDIKNSVRGRTKEVLINHGIAIDSTEEIDDILKQINEHTKTSK